MKISKAAKSSLKWATRKAMGAKKRHAFLLHE